MAFKHTPRQKSKIALFLFGVMLCTVLIRILEDKSIQKMNDDFVSLYNDRLIPATDLFFLAENLYAKRYLTERSLHEQSAEDRLDRTKRLALHSENINTLIAKYEKTFLTASEKKQLQELKQELKRNEKIERQLLLNPDQETEAQLALASQSFDAIAKKLTALTEIQQRVGEELLKDSRYRLSGSNLYSNIQFGLAIVIGILIVAIVTTSNVVKVANEKFNLN